MGGLEWEGWRRRGKTRGKSSWSEERRGHTLPTISQAAHCLDYLLSHCSHKSPVQEESAAEGGKWRREREKSGGEGRGRASRVQESSLGRSLGEPTTAATTSLTSCRLGQLLTPLTS